jgi:hypothetical protein
MDGSNFAFCFVLFPEKDPDGTEWSLGTGRLYLVSVPVCHGLGVLDRKSKAKVPTFMRILLFDDMEDMEAVWLPRR